MEICTKNHTWLKLRRILRSLLIPTFGLFCVLIGLTEMTRVILLYSAEYGFFVGFPLEIGLYVVGIVWSIHHYAKDFKKAASDVKSTTSEHSLRR